MERMTGDTREGASGHVASERSERGHGMSPGPTLACGTRDVGTLGSHALRFLMLLGLRPLQLHATQSDTSRNRDRISW